MKKLLLALFIGSFIFISSGAQAKRPPAYRPSPNTVVVQGYYKSNGTYVAPHIRTINKKKRY